MTYNEEIYCIDLFSGAGGTTTGVHMVQDGIKVVACVNHDKNAIESHKANHPDCLHFVEDVRNWHVVDALEILVKNLRAKNPGCKIVIWASLECTNYSKAKGGLPRDADSRTLAHALYMRYNYAKKQYEPGDSYIQKIKPDYIDIENVREFMAWGPLDENGRPISKLAGIDYVAWVNTIKSFGYNFDHRLLNAADFGAHTSRERFFGQFAASGLPIVWPDQTHTKNPDKKPGLKKWKPVREVLDLTDEGTSIFTRKKPLSENTLKRIYAGLVKFVANGDDTFIQKYFSGDIGSKVFSINGPAHTITTIDHQSPVFIKRYNGGNPAEKVSSVNSPLGTISTNNRHAVVKPCFLQHYYGNGFSTSIEQPCPTIRTKDSAYIIDYQYKSNSHSIGKPAPTIVTKDKLATVQSKFITNYYSGGGQLSDINNPGPAITSVPKQRLTTAQFIDQQFGNSLPHNTDRPAGTITVNPKQNLVSAKPWIMDTNFNNTGSSIDKPSPVITASHKWHYLLNPSWGGATSSIDKPSPVIVARQDKAPVFVVQANSMKYFAIPFFDHENETMKKIRLFMAIHGIIDIKMRMLKIIELLKIQGFPENYILKGTQTERKKYIGNAVVPLVAKAIMQAKVNAIRQIDLRQIV